MRVGTAVRVTRAPTTLVLVAVLAVRPVVVGAQSTAADGASPLRGCCTTSALSWAVVDTAPSLLAIGHPAAWGARTLPARVLAVTLDGAQGDWRRPQQPRTTIAGAVQADGWRAIGGWRTQGTVRYARQQDRAVPWVNASDAYLGSPYVWADSIGGDWARDLLALRTGVATPETRRWGAGLGIDYAIGQGARRNAARPLFRRRVLDVVPGVHWTIATGQRLGVQARLGWTAEDQEIGGGAGPDDPIVFRLRGLGTFDRTQLISAERAVVGRVQGATVGYSVDGARWQGVVHGGLTQLRDSVRDGIGRPVPGGSSRRLRYDGGARVRRRAAAGGVDLSARYGRETQRGTDPFFGAVNVIDVGDHLSLGATWWRGASPVDARWQLAAVAAGTQLSRRDVVAETEWTARTVPLRVTLRRQSGADGAGWLVGGTAGVDVVVDSSWAAARPTRLTPVLVRPDFLAHALGRQWVGAQLGYVWRAPAGQRRVLVEWDAARRAAPSDAGGSGVGRQWWRVTFTTY